MSDSNFRIVIKNGTKSGSFLVANGNGQTPAGLNADPPPSPEVTKAGAATNIPVIWFTIEGTSMSTNRLVCSPGAPKMYFAFLAAGQEPVYEYTLIVNAEQPVATDLTLEGLVTYKT
jgi:hypothetical protein